MKLTFANQIVLVEMLFSTLATVSVFSKFLCGPKSLNIHKLIQNKYLQS